MHIMSHHLSFLSLSLLSGYGEKPLLPDASCSGYNDDNDNNDDDDDNNPWIKSRKEHAGYEDIFPSETTRAKNKGKKQVTMIVSFFLLSHVKSCHIMSDHVES